MLFYPLTWFLGKEVYDTRLRGSKGKSGQSDKFIAFSSEGRWAPDTMKVWVGEGTKGRGQK